MYSTKEDSMTIPISVHSWHKKTDIQALLDSGATHNFIDKRTIQKLALGTRPLPQPRTLHNVDGTNNREGSVTHFCNLWVQRGKMTKKLGFFVTNLGHDRLILGHPWFQTFNPTIDWSTNSLPGDTVHIETAGYRTKYREKLMVIKTSSNQPQKIDPSIPPYYHCHAQVFDEKASHCFPPAQNEHHVITLKPDAPATIKCKVVTTVRFYFLPLCIPFSFSFTLL